ncbi:hypothetical protein TIFTF001_023772 [Ficus carica]|uniref:Uncharacterized protein n=1 Tax=Ficus carica TaxID=3494 RepID=A0AA88AK78_FICCA|nr:hypothetical protein TIFTF001_023772 [Ficus carica]
MDFSDLYMSCPVGVPNTWEFFLRIFAVEVHGQYHVGGLAKPLPHFSIKAFQRSSEPWVAQILGGGEDCSIATVGSMAGNKLARQPRLQFMMKGVQIRHGEPAARRSPQWARRRGDPALGLRLDNSLDLVSGSGRPMGMIEIVIRWFSGSVGLDDATEEDGLPVAVATVAPGISGSNHLGFRWRQSPISAFSNSLGVFGE